MPTTFVRTLNVAAKILGGVDNLQQHLGVGRIELHSWLHGHSTPPSDVFLRAVDVLLDENGY